MAYMVKFWGVRGSIACASPQHVVYGGNTSCLEFTLGDNTLIFDAGTGLRFLGQSLVKRGVTKATLMFTHTHWDHINGFPFFVPAFNPAFDLKIMAGHLGGAEGAVRAILARQMDNPTFPVPLETMRSNMRFVDFRAGETLHPFDGVVVKTAPLRHPNEATGYRVEYGGKAACYVTDTEHVPGQPDANVLGLIQGADLVIYDSTYTDDEFPARVGWGHSTWQEGIRLCRAAQVKQLAIFHHDPDHDDTFMSALEAEARQTWEGAVVARDGMEITLI